MAHHEPPVFDLQSHSTWSDGALAPAAVVEQAARAGVELLALTDHDSIDGTAEAQAAAARHGLRLVTGVEISSIDDDGLDLHLLGYGVDAEHPALISALEEFRRDREVRGEAMLSALHDLGFELDATEVRNRRAAGLAVGRPHIARAVTAHPGNAERLAAEGLTRGTDVLVAYLIPGAPAFRPRTFPTVPDAIALVHQAGGYAVWAHPFFDIKDDEHVERRLRQFVAAGVDGVEAFYIEHSSEQTHFLCDLAEELDLLTTGSADFHAPNHRTFNRFRAFDLYGRSPNLGPIATGQRR